MVNKKTVSEEAIRPTSLEYTSIKLSEIYPNQLRLDADSYNIAAISAMTQIKNNKFGYVNLWSENGLVANAYHRPRFKRTYVNHKEIPFYQPSAITEVYPRPSRYISQHTPTNIESLRVKKGMLLMTISGTIGKVAIAGKSIDNQVFSHDLLRLQGEGKYDTGYIYAYFLTEKGQHILQSNNYGAVIKHIEPEHLKNIIIPNAPEALKKNIHQLVMQSYQLRDDSNDLIDQAEQTLLQELQLPPIEDIKVDSINSSAPLKNFSTKLSTLQIRLDASFHLPLYTAIQKHLAEHTAEILPLKNSLLTQSIILPGRFKRTYVEPKFGIKFIGGKQIYDLNPMTKKYLSKSIHNTRIGEELTLKENCILVTRSGTIGRVTIVPRHWQQWAANDHIIRIFPKNNKIAGYIYCWLNTEYGLQLIQKHTYGSVINEIDSTHVGNIPLPILKNQQKQQKINDLVLQANELRYQAHLKEQEAIKKMKEIINTTK